MNKLLLVALFCVAAVLAEGNVKILTPDNFDSVVDGSKGVFVEFFAPWCGHCKKLAPEYEIVADAFAKTASIVIASVDADAHSTLGSRFGVTGFPTLKYFPAGSTTPEEYNGGRAAEDIVEWINNKVGTRVKIPKAVSAVTVLDDKNFDSIVKDTSKNVLVEFYAPWCGHCKSLAPTWEKLAAAFKNEPSVVIANIDADKYKTIGGAYGVSGFPTLKFFSKDSKAGTPYEGGRDLQELVDYINENAGTDRTTSGTLGPDAGTIEELDELAKKFASGDKAALLKEAEKAAASADLTDAEKKSAKVYLKVFTSAKDNAAYVKTETERLQKLITSGSVTPNKADEFQVRLNILRAFQ